jgi:hypothetical protein
LKDNNVSNNTDTRIAGCVPAQVCLLLLLFANAPVTVAAWFIDSGLQLEYNNNLANAELDVDIVEDTALLLSLVPGYYLQLDDYSGLSLSAGLDAAKQNDYPGLDNLAAGLNASLRRKFGLGPDVPWSRLSISVARIDFDDQKRDGWKYLAGIAAGKRIGQRWDVQINYLFERRRSDEVEDIPSLASNRGIFGNAYDVDSHSLSATGIFTINVDWALALAYTRRMGEVWSTTLRNSEIFQASDAITPDPVFGADRFAYRIDADSNIFRFGINRGIGNHLSAELGYTYRDSKAKGGLAYTNSLLQFRLNYTY